MALKLFNKLGLFSETADVVLEARYAQIAMMQTARRSLRARRPVSPFMAIARAA